jgi:cytochrome b involved in lipid metabolism
MRKLIYLLLVLVIAVGCTAETNDIVLQDDITENEPTLEDENIQVNEDAVFLGITREEIAQNNDASSCYVAWKGEVYDLTQWLRAHPGGAQAILPYCGTVEEFEEAYQQQHNQNGARDDGLLRNDAIGVLI